MKAILTYTFLVILAFIAAPFLAAGTHRGPIASSYTSEWRVVAPGETATFTHGLGVRPLDVHVWGAPGADKNLPATAEPVANFPGVSYRVDAGQVTVTNAGAVPLKIQVYARP